MPWLLLQLLREWTLPEAQVRERRRSGRMSGKGDLVARRRRCCCCWRGDGGGGRGGRVGSGGERRALRRTGLPGRCA